MSNATAVADGRTRTTSPTGARVVSGANRLLLRRKMEGLLEGMEARPEKIERDLRRASPLGGSDGLPSAEIEPGLPVELAAAGPQ